MLSKRSVILCLISIFTVISLNVHAQEVIKTSALKSNNYGVTYILPKTVLVINAEFSKTTLKAGLYAKYAEKYLGAADNVITEDMVIYNLDEVEISSKGIPDKNEAYVIEFKAKTSAPFVYLTKDGVICTINAEYTPEESTTKKEVKKPSVTVPVPGVQSAYTEEYLRAGSVSKMAEVAAKQIYKLRESRMDILTGDAENTPKDGEAMKIVLQQLEAQEKALVELFTGTRSIEKEFATFEADPTGNMEKEIIFRFSKYLGVVDADDLSGSPVYMNLKKIDSIEEAPVDPKAKKETKGIVYNIPGRASVELFFGIQQLFRGNMEIVQFGTKQILGTSIFEDKKGPVKVHFYPETGGIKQIQ
ncbi:MAG: DUF4831 family protein [Dysgonamonadaceae bacterium]|jgi:hypothetical protein|nr:DUF4831 family protein [Dysgonamonadaceae bacterium]